MTHSPQSFSAAWFGEGTTWGAGGCCPGGTFPDDGRAIELEDNALSAGYVGVARRTQAHGPDPVDHRMERQA